MSSEDAPVTATLVTGAPLACLVCGHDLFVERQAQIRFSTLSFALLLGWKTAKCRVCGRCGFVHWFLEPRRGLVAGS